MAKETVHYMCGTDFEHEAKSPNGCLDVYSSVEEVKNHKKCWKECGIIEFTMNEIAEVTSQKVIIPKKI